MTARIDLHLHTTFSDGTLSPEALVVEAAARGVTLIAVTDHDEMAGIRPAQEAASKFGIEVISGVEINTEVGREDVHVLGYGFAPNSPVMQEKLAERRLARVRRMQRMLERLASLGYPVDETRVLTIAGQGSVGRPHVARALLEAGHVAHMQDAFERLIGQRCPAYVPTEPFTPQEAIALIHAAGGIASLAHPGKLGDPIRFIRQLQGAGLDALEAYHPDHSTHVTERLLKWANQYKLAVTGGTDCHGPGGTRVVPIGSLPIPDEIGERLKTLLQSRSL